MRDLIAGLWAGVRGTTGYASAGRAVVAATLMLMVSGGLVPLLTTETSSLTADGVTGSIVSRWPEPLLHCATVRAFRFRYPTRAALESLDALGGGRVTGQASAMYPGRGAAVE